MAKKRKVSEKRLKTALKKTDKIRKANRKKSDLKKDYKRKAKAPGKRKSKSGKTYYEYRANRSDAKGKRI